MAKRRSRAAGRVSLLADAESAYRDLSMYRIAISLEENGWLVDYELKDPELQGGGPHYVRGRKKT
jgi:hypothetical protein